MPRKLNLIGQRFGKLVVIEPAPSKSGKTYWKCKCDCGNYKTVQGNHLKNGKVISCGCYKKEVNPFLSLQDGETKICPVCGNRFVPNNAYRIYCFDCVPVRISSKERIKRIDRLIKHKLIQYKRRKCERCGYNKCEGALQFHHINPEEKEFTVSQVNLNENYTIEKLYKEVDKCLLLCANCHAEEHYT